jgi:signal transduction histidine kinase
VEGVTAPDLPARWTADEVALPVVRVRGDVVVAATASARALLGVAPGEPLARCVEGPSRRKLAAALASVAPVSCEVQLAPRDGEEARSIDVLVLPLDAREHVVVVTRVGPAYSTAMAEQLLDANARLADLAREVSRRATALDAARRRLVEIGERRDRFVTVLAHDIRGPLAALGLLAASVRRAATAGAGAERIVTLADQMRRSVRRMNALVHDVLDTARLDAGTLALKRERIALRAGVDEVLETYGPVAEAEGLRLELVDDAPGVEVDADPVRLGQIVGNLVDNALRHSPPGDVVRVSLSATPTHACVVVEDRGPGIPAERRASMFERFAQGERGGAVGMGLYVVRELVRLHGGDVRIEDAAPHGTRFVVELPRISGA